MNLHKTVLDRIVMNWDTDNLRIFPFNDYYRNSDTVFDLLKRVDSYDGIEAPSKSIEAMFFMNPHIIIDYVKENDQNGLPLITGGEGFSINTETGVYHVESLGAEAYTFTAIKNGQYQNRDGTIENLDVVSSSEVTFLGIVKKTQILSTVKPEVLLVSKTIGEFPDNVNFTSNYSVGVGIEFLAAVTNHAISNYLTVKQGPE